MKNDGKIITEIKELLKSKIFMLQNKKSCLFEDDTYAILPGNISLFLSRDNIVWNNIKPKHKYSISHYRSQFIFTTYKNELHPEENNFYISINITDTCTITLTPIGYKMQPLQLISV